MLPVQDGGRVPFSAGLVVQVSRHDSATNTDVPLGSATSVLGGGDLSIADHDAVVHVVQSVQYIQDRFNYAGFNDANNAVQLILNATDGPVVRNATLSIPSTNVMANVPGAIGAADVVLPRDAAQHELGHILQYELTGRPITGAIESPDSLGNADIRSMSVSEGIADTFAALALHSWRTGAEFFAPGSPITAARDYDDPNSTHNAQQVRTDFYQVKSRQADAHVEGGVIPTTFRELEQRIGWSKSEDVLWGVLNDTEFGASKQEWYDFAAALERQATWRNADTATAIRSSMSATDLSSTITGQQASRP